MHPAIGKNIDSLPPILYKYRNFDVDGYGMSMAINGDVFFPSSRSLNDPFENYFIPQSKAHTLPKKELRKYLYEKTKQRFGDRSFVERAKLLRTALKRAESQKRNPSEHAIELQEYQHNYFGILSLTKCYSSLPMWAYYAANHSGFCVGFKTTAIEEHQKILFEKHDKLMSLREVNYTDEIPVVNIDTPLDGEATNESIIEEERPHYTKYVHWKHEDEIRLILWKFPDFPYSFGRDSIEEVIFGVNVNEENKQQMIEALKTSGSQAKIKQAKKAYSTYGLEFESIA